MIIEGHVLSKFTLNGEKSAVSEMSVRLSDLAMQGNGHVWVFTNGGTTQSVVFEFTSAQTKQAFIDSAQSIFDREVKAKKPGMKLTFSDPPLPPVVKRSALVR